MAHVPLISPKDAVSLTMASEAAVYLACVIPLASRPWLLPKGVWASPAQQGSMADGIGRFAACLEKGKGGADRSKDGAE